MAHILQEYKAYSLQGHAVAHKYVQTIYTYTVYDIHIMYIRPLLTKTDTTWKHNSRC